MLQIVLGVGPPSFGEGSLSHILETTGTAKDIDSSAGEREPFAWKTAGVNDSSKGAFLTHLA